MMPMVVSFYTDDWIYPLHAARLVQECARSGVPSHVRELPSTGSYLRNTCLKPRFLLDTMQQFKQPLLWVDVDGSLLQPPALLPGLAANYDWAARPITQPGRVRAWHVGTIWLNYTQATMDFLAIWAKTAGNTVTDEAALHRIWPVEGLRTFKLPPEYFYIQNRRAKYPPVGTVIMHRLSEGESKRREYRIAAEDERTNG